MNPLPAQAPSLITLTHPMKTKNLLFAIPALAIPALAATAPLSFAGPPVPAPAPVAPIDPVVESIGLWDARLPITNPVYADLAVPVTHLRPLFIYQSMPDKVRTVLGDVPVGGDFQLYALQFEYAFNERISLIAKKDGYIDFNPDETLSEEDGWANIAAGLKYAFLYDPASRFALSGSFLLEFPTGNTSVWQGTGDGSITPMVSALKLWDTASLQLTGTTGFVIPFDSGANSSSYFLSGGLSFGLTDWLFPTVEANYFRVIDEGDGGQRFNDHVGGLVPGIVTFEGGDLVNLGASNADINPDIVTLGLGFRLRPHQRVDLGFAWEFPLTTEEENLMENRFTVDLVWRF